MNTEGTGAKSAQGYLDERVAPPHPEHETARLSGTIIRGSNGAPLGGALVSAEEMSSGDTHYGVSDDQGDFCIEGLPIDRMYEVKLGKNGIVPTFMTVFLSSDKDLGTMALSHWQVAASSGPPSETGRSLTPRTAR